MKAVVYAQKDKVEVRDLPLREMGPDEAKIQIAFSSICATDVHIVTEGLYGLPFGWPLGHEASGTIVEVGEKAAAHGFKIRDRVAINPIRFCGACYYCRNGQEQYCARIYEMPISATFAEYGVYHESQLFKLPDSVSLKAAALTEPLTACMRAMDLARMRIGNRVLISGAGGIGLILLQLVKLQGGTAITVVEPVEAKRNLAVKLGADYVIDPLTQDIVAEAMKITNNLGYDYIFEASGAPSAAPPCLNIVAKCGRIIYFSVFPADYELPVNLQKLYDQEAGILTVMASPYLFPRGVATLAKLDMEAIVGAVYPLDEAPAAFEAHKQSLHPKILLKCS
jgi:(R,R)-butanediol dehydrogenase / meso-butanediol dehydrogenase / diacetyl reductase